jgi:preprotein translocase subunit SecE
MANPTAPPVETVSTGADKAKLAAAGILVVVAVVAFYLLGKQDLWVRVAALIVLMVVAAATFFTSEPGKQLIAYGQDSIREVKKVVWPTRKGSAADDRLRIRLRRRDGALSLAHRQDARVGSVRPDPRLEALRNTP